MKMTNILPEIGPKDCNMKCLIWMGIDVIADVSAQNVTIKIIIFYYHKLKKKKKEGGKSHVYNHIENIIRKEDKKKEQREIP